MCHVQLGVALCLEGVDPASKKRYAGILGAFTAKLTDARTTPKEAAVAVQAVGDLAAATKHFYGTKVGFIHAGTPGSKGLGGPSLSPYAPSAICISAVLR